MGLITSSVGLVSGINTGSIVNQLIAIQQQPVTNLQVQIATAEAQQQAYTNLSQGLQSLQTIGNQLALPQTFDAATTSSSDPNTLTATAAVGAALGSYQLQVAQLVTTQQTVSQGYANESTTPIGAGTITLEQGGGEASSETPLSQLNGGQGVPTGQFRITDRSGASSVIDTSSDITLDDVVKQINTALGTSVTATVTDNGLQLQDNSGKTTSNLIVQDLNGGTTAKALGIAGSVATNTLNGTNINTISASTGLNTLNDGNGITPIGNNPDFKATLANGTTINITLAGATTVGDVLKDINTVGNGKLKAAISADGTGLTLTDTTSGSGTFGITSLNGSPAASQLGILGTGSGGTLAGKPVIAALDSVLTSSLKGGSGISLGTISITDRTGKQANINLSGATSVSDILGDINSAGLSVTAALNQSGTGIQLTDTSGDSGNLIVSDVNSTTATQLGLAGTYGTSTATVDGGNLQRQYISANTQLSSYNGGQGVTLGQFRLTNSKGVSATVDLTQGDVTTVGGVLSAINSSNIGVTASINSNGNGILLTDNSGGSGHLAVSELGSTTATDLNIVGTASANTIDGAQEKTISVSSTDTLDSLTTKINDLGFGVTATVVNDGSSTNPYRLSITSLNSGAAGRVLIDTGATGIQTQNLVKAQDAAVFFGGAGSAQPILVTSNTNQLTNLIKGVTVNLTGASSSPVTLTVSQDPSSVEQSLSTFTSGFNTLVSDIDTDTAYDSTTNQGGPLFGDGTVLQIQQALYSITTASVSGAGQYKSLADIGITVGNGATLSFDTNTFEQAIAANPTAVQNLFSQATTGLGNVIANTINTLTDPVSGVITLEDQSISNQTSLYNDQITFLNGLISDNRNVLETQFANMEVSLAQLQAQSQALSSFTGSSASSAASSSSSSSS